VLNFIKNASTNISANPQLSALEKGMKFLKKVAADTAGHCSQLPLSIWVQTKCSHNKLPRGGRGCFSIYTQVLKNYGQLLLY